MNQPDDLIFISIASYRDPQLVPTIDDLIAKAAHPEWLRFGVCQQRGVEEPLLPYADDLRFRVLDVDWRDSRGACWARAEIMKLYRGEDWFLQVDSHCRFAANWDEKLIATAKQTMSQTGSAKPILTTYGSAFAPSASGQKEVLGEGPMVIAVQSFTADGLPELKPMLMPHWQRRRSPMRARFIGAGFLFAAGGFVSEIGYDPELYFYGEEASLTVRAYTSGYDLFHPHQTLVWHDYIRANNTRHWENHTELDEISEVPGVANRIDGDVNSSGDEPGDPKPAGLSGWRQRDAYSREKVRRLLSGEPVESCGPGSVRTLREYEEYAGVSFSLRKAQDYTRRGEEPPNPPAPPDWPEKIHDWMARITIDFLALPPGALGDPAFWYVAITDDRCAELYRRDFPPSELKKITGSEDKIVLICEFQSSTIPDKWVVQPVSKSAGWLKRVSGSFTESDYAIIVPED